MDVTNAGDLVSDPQAPSNAPVVAQHAANARLVLHGIVALERELPSTARRKLHAIGGRVAHLVYALDEDDRRRRARQERLLHELGRQEREEQQRQQRPPLKEPQCKLAKVLVGLKEGQAIMRKQLSTKSGVPPGTMGKHLRELRVWGLRERRGAGYYIDTEANRAALAEAVGCEQTITK